MLVTLAFAMGIANFALHKAVLSSRHPMLGQLGWSSRRGARVTLGIEFGVLLLAMLLANEGWPGAVWAYAGYTAINAFAAWLILTHRI